MNNNNKLLVIFSLLIVIVGVSFFLIGVTPPKTITTVPSPTMEESSSSAIVATSSAIAGVQGEQALVDRVVDGDTIVVLINGQDKTVRFVGMDTPETVDPKRPVGCYGKEASNETKSLLTGKMVILQKDVSDTDKYKRLLRYIYLPLPDGQTLFVNDFLVREGYAKVLTYPPDTKYDAQFKQAQEFAKQAKKGLWGSC